MTYNKTQLHPESTFERHVFHRDQFAHYLRWTHVLKVAKIGMNILDFGCGNANLLEVFYRNRFKPKQYVGIDIRKQTINNNKEKYKHLKYAKFFNWDLAKHFNFYVSNHYDLIVCFEVIEHIGKENADAFLLNIKRCMNDKTILLLSTPVFDKKVGAAKNHIINGEVCEFTFEEMRNLLKKHFEIERIWGTFASQKDYKHKLHGPKKWFFDRLHEYYDTNILSNLMAPMFPMESRNCLWRCKLK